MDHQEGKDPAKKGPFEGFQPHGPSRQPADNVESEKYHNSAPPASVQQDGVYFFGYKRELGPGEPTEHL
jgi:hypothetical protein